MPTRHFRFECGDGIEAWSQEVGESEPIPPSIMNASAIEELDHLHDPFRMQTFRFDRVDVEDDDREVWVYHCVPEDEIVIDRGD
ncbi:MAG: hypothetical protein U0Q22_03490 [Acidimicrobiales bacterium]